VETDVALYVALIAASILLAGMVLLFRLYKNKGRDHSMYNMANSGAYYYYYHYYYYHLTKTIDNTIYDDGIHNINTYE